MKILNDIGLSFAFIYHPTKNCDSSTPFVAGVWAELFLGAISTSFDYNSDIDYNHVLYTTRNPAPSRTAFSKKWHLENGNSIFKVENK